MFSPPHISYLIYRYPHAAIVYHNIHSETPISRTDLYPTYNQFANQLLESANVSRRVQII